jgi:predicted Rossmann fold nucleotide-binding protein DprA/Smf involved in DNA uptake
MKAAEAIEVLIAADVCLIGGWHSPLEMALLEDSRTAQARLGLLLATGPDHAVVPNRVRERVESGAGFVLTHCTPRVRRITRAAALQRNRLVVALATALFVPLGPPGSATFGAAARAATAGKPVLTTDLAANRELLAAGAVRFSPAALANALANRA